jgi:hypothetical protein
VRFESRFDPWKDHGVPLIAMFELNGSSVTSAYKIESRMPYFIYYDKGFMPGHNLPVYVVEDRHPSRRGEVVSLLNVDNIPSHKNSALKAHLMPLNSNYRIIPPAFIIRNQNSPDQPARIDNNQAEFDLGLVVKLAHKTNKSLVISVRVERQ